MMNRTSFEGEALAQHVFQAEPPQQEMDSSGSSSSLLRPPKLIATFSVNAYCYLVECGSEILVAASSRGQPSQFLVSD